MPLPVNRYPNKLAPKLPNNIPRNIPFCFFASFLIASLKLFVNKQDSSTYLTIFIISFISSLEIVKVVPFATYEVCIPDPNIFLWIAASVAVVVSVNLNGLKTLLAIGLRTFPIKGNPFFN